MPPHPNPEDLLHQLLDLERLDQLPRTGYLQRGVSPAESVTEHAWHVAVVAWAVLPHVDDVDPLRALELALLHDVGELTMGDIPRPGAMLLPAGAKQEGETRALRQILAASGTRAEELIDELAARASREAEFVHACDRLQLLIKTLLYARWGRGDCADFLAELLGVTGAGGRPQIDECGFPIIDELRAAAARRAADLGLLQGV